MSTSASSLTISAPAKINLGLEILGERADGFHEIRTLMAMLEFGDHLTVSIAPESTVRGVPGVDQDTNLISRAVDIYRRTSETAIDVRVTAIKRIPMAAGLGGASADAAATLIAVNALVNVPLPAGAILRLAESLGSDVPFFLGSPLALSSGTGTDISPLVPVPMDVILIIPDLTIPNKTRVLYGMLNASDFSNGKRIECNIRSLAGRNVPVKRSLANAFERPLYTLAPDLISLRHSLDRLDSRGVGLSGAGPAHYVIPNPGSARQTEQDLRALVPLGTKVISTRARLTGLDRELRSQVEQD